MFRNLVSIGLGWFVYTKTGRKTACNICRNLVPYIEKELGVNIVEPIKELTKDPEKKEVKDARNNDEI